MSLFSDITVVVLTITSLFFLIIISILINFKTSGIHRIFNPSDFYELDGKPKRKAVLILLFLMCVTIGTVWFISYQGIKQMLFWIPHSWGSHSEDGEWYSAQYSISSLLGLYFGLMVTWSMFQYSALTQRILKLQYIHSILEKNFGRKESLTIIIEELESSINEYGCTPRKSNALQFLKSLNEFIEQEVIYRERKRHIESENAKEVAAALLHQAKVKKQEEERVDKFKKLRELHLPDFRLIGKNNDSIADAKKCMLRVNDEMIKSYWNPISSAYWKVVERLSKKPDDEEKINPLKLQEIGCCDIESRDSVAIFYEGDVRNGNGCIIAVGENEKKTDLISTLRVKITLQGFLSAYFVIWGAREYGAIDHGHYNAPGFLYTGNNLLDILVNTERRLLDSLEIIPVLKTHSGIRITNELDKYKIACLGYRANVGFSDYWIEISDQGLLLNTGETVVLKNSVTIFY